MQIFYDTSLNSKNMGGVLKATMQLFAALAELAPNLVIKGISRKPSVYIFSKNVHNSVVKFPYESILWRSTVYPIISYLYPNDVFYFEANGNIPSFMNPKMFKIMTLHDVLQLEIPNYFKNDEDKQKFVKQIQNSIDKADILLTVSEYSKSQILKNFKVSKEIIVMHNAGIMDESQFNSSFEPNKEPFFLFNGGWRPRKSLDKLVKIFIQLKKRNKLNDKLLICGTPEYHIEGLKELIDEAIAIDAVELLGYVDDAKMKALLTSAKGLLYPSKLEGFGLPPLEAMEMGCPVIAEYATSIPEICEDAVIYSDIDETEKYCENLISLSENADKRKELAEKGFERVKKFSWLNSGRILLKAIEDFKK